MHHRAAKLYNIEVSLTSPHLILGHTHKSLRIFPMRLAFADVGVEALRFEGGSVLQINQQALLAPAIITHLIERHSLRSSNLHFGLGLIEIDRVVTRQGFLISLIITTAIAIPLTHQLACHRHNHHIAQIGATRTI